MVPSAALLTPRSPSPARPISTWDRQTGSWYRALGASKKAVIRELHEVTPWRNAILLVHLALWLAACWCVVRGMPWPGRLVAYALMGTVLQGLGVLMHDALHGSLFRRRRLDRLAAFLLGVCVLVPSAAFRVTHFRHHRYARGPLDPDELCNNVRAGWRLRAAFYVVMPLGLPVFLLHLATQGVALAGARERRAIFWQLAAMGMVYSSLFALPSAARPWIVHGWLFPLVASSVWVSLRNWSEHLCTDPGHPLTRSRTVTSNALTRFFLFNVNYHLEHHLFPAVPWYNLPQVHALLRPEYALAGANVCSSYLHFLGAAARGGVEAVVGADA